MAEKNISSVRIVIREFLSKTRNINESNVWEWFSSFRETLAYQEYSEQKNEYAEHLLADADNYIAMCYVQGIEGAMAKTMEKTELSYNAVHDACCEKYGDEYIAAKSKEKSYLADHPGTETIWTKKYRKFIDGADGEQKAVNRTKALPKGAKETDPATTNQAQPAAPKPQPCTPGKPSLAYSGRGGNVHLTDDEYAMLLQELGNKRKADKLIDSLDYAISEGKTFNAPHFHVLMHWNDYREEKAAEAAEMAKVNADARAEAYSKRGYKTAEERQQEELAKINDFCTGLRNGTIKIAKEG